MLKSMTGFGRGECTRYDRRFKVEIKSVNHRYGDYSLRLPRFLHAFEDRLRKILAQHIARGKVEVWVGFESYTERDVTARVNWAFADAYAAALAEMRVRYAWPGTVAGTGENPGNTELELLARNPDIIIFEKYEAAHHDKTVQNEMKETLEAALEEALRQFNAMRRTEGEALAADIRGKVTQIRALAAQIGERLGPAIEEHAQRLRERLTDILSRINGEHDIDEGRFISEIAILADKGAIDEELTRLASHLSQLDDILLENQPVGRKLDFLVQEINREVNTMGAKSSDVLLGKLVVALKSEVEKIREQVQNVE